LRNGPRCHYGDPGCAVVGRRKEGPGQVDLFAAHIPSASLNGANLRDANLNVADLSGAILESADLGGAYLRGAYLVSANLAGADLSGTHELTQAQLDSACGDEKRRLDPPLTIKPCRTQ
jgi:uncharacterized protein YjbI with pentapeptide repeats